MKFKKAFIASNIAIIIICFAALASAGNSQQNENKNFNSFAKFWVTKLNRSNIKGISRMEILRKSDGSYLARYHYIDPESISCTVKNNSSKRNRSVGLLKYTENVYECSAPSPKDARKGKFKVSKAMRVTEIFSNNGHGWR